MHWNMRRTFTQEERLDRAVGYRVVIRLLGYVRPYKFLAIGSVVAMLLYSATIVANPWLIREAIDTVVEPPGTFSLTTVVVLMVVNSLVSYVTDYLRLVTLSRVGQNLLFALRTATFNHLQRLSISFFDRTEVGSTMSRVQNDVQQLQEFLAIFILALGDILVLVGIVVAMVLMNWQLALITFSIIPFLFGMVIFWQRYAWPSFMQVRRDMAGVNAGLQENISGVRVIQSLNRQSENLRMFDRTSHRYLDSSLGASRLSSALNPAVEVITAGATGLVIVFGGMMYLRGDLDISVVVAFALYIQLFFNPVRSLTMQYGQLQRAVTSGAHIFEILDTESQITDRPGAVELPPLKGDVSFENVGFSYTPEVQVLEGINLHIRPGEKVALVGPTGAGKTTLASLLPRLHDVTEGKVAVDGYDLRDVVRNSLNRQISVVPQEPFLFSGTVKDNIRYCNLETSDEAIFNAARAVGAHHFIMRLVKGYDTQVEERGQNFSPGERQLISLARALVPDPRIIILDEATATVDSHTEMFIQRGLKEVLRGRTALIIAHRLSTVREVDQIVVMDKGRILEQGTHRELMEGGGHYARLQALSSSL